MIGFAGPEIDASLRQAIQQWRVGGVILFDRNIRGPKALFRLCRELQELRRQVSDRPLLIAVDQEGGAVARVREGATVFPPNRALGFAGTVQDAFAQGRITGGELSRLGINMNLAPVLDLCHPRGSPSLGLRSLGSDPGKVAELGEALIRGMQREGIIATAKHFPGKGRARLDSHRDLPVIETSAATLGRRDLLPFRRAVRAGVKAVMTSHAAYPTLGGARDRPGTLTPRLMTGLLRRRLGFTGVLISDDLGMGAIAGRRSVEEAVREGLAAGVDIFLVCHSPEEWQRAFQELERIGSGSVELKRRLEESGERIAAVKAGLRAGPGSAGPSESANDLARRIARGAISLAGARKDWPVPAKDLLLIWFRPRRTVEVESAGEEEGPEIFFRAAGFDPEVVAVSLDPGREERAGVRNRLSGSRSILVTSFDAYRHRGQRELISEILQLRPEAPLAILRDPRDADLFPAGENLIITRGYGPWALRALAELLAAGRSGDKE